MKKIIIALLLLIMVSRLTAQVLVNGDFSSVCSSPPSGSCASGFGIVENPCVNNWFRVTGSPCLFGTGTTHFVILESSDQSYTPAGSVLTPDGFGSQGIGASYPFLKGGCYKVTISPNFSPTNYCPKSSLSIEVWAANSLIQPAGTPLCFGASPSIPGSFEKIGIKTYAPGEVGPTTPLTFNYTATKNNTQILIFVKQNSMCTNVTIMGPGPEITVTQKVGLVFDIGKVSIELGECKKDCKDDEWLVNHSSQIASGGIFKHSGIRAGGSVAPGGDAVVSPPSNKNTMLMGGYIQLRNNFKAVVDADHLFSATPSTGCKCILENPIFSWTGAFTVKVGCTLKLGDSTLGGTWSGNDNDRATIDPVSGLVTGINSSIGGSGDVDITYTVGDCSTTVRIHVIPTSTECGCCISKEAQDNPVTESNTDNELIRIFPNPAQNSITISYPCNANKNLEINVKDISGRNMYMESVPCNGDNITQHQVNISNLLPGMYIVELTMDAQHTIKKILKM